MGRKASDMKLGVTVNWPDRPSTIKHMDKAELYAYCKDCEDKGGRVVFPSNWDRYKPEELA